MTTRHGRPPQESGKPVTDVDDYLASNPQFAECREEGHSFPRSRDVPLLEAYGDEDASHHKILVCGGCKTKKRERFLITFRRGKVASFVQLDSRGDYSDAVGYLTQGVRINRRYVKEFAIRRELEAAATAPEAQIGTAARRQARNPIDRESRKHKRGAVAA